MQRSVGMVICYCRPDMLGKGDGCMFRKYEQHQMWLVVGAMHVWIWVISTHTSNGATEPQQASLIHHCSVTSRDACHSKWFSPSQTGQTWFNDPYLCAVSTIRHTCPICFMLDLKDTPSLEVAALKFLISLCFDPLFLSEIWTHGHTVREMETGMHCNK